MSSGDEFSFIRCPSCNSLIPSKATRCRMCGHVLSEGGEAAPSGEEQKRVTQKTVSIKSLDLDDIRESIPEMQDEPEVEEPVVEEEVIEEDDLIEEEEPQQEEEETERPKKSKRNRRSRNKKKRVEAEHVEEKKEPEDKPAPPAPKPKRSGGSNAVMFEEAGSSKVNGLTPLVGWFVSYDEASAGITFEIRTGRYLISREALRDTDVVLEDSLLSTPHCILKASVADGISIQDLMSEHGTHVKKGNRNKFQTCETPTVLETGDILKLGSTEMVVVLVPQGKAKNEEADSEES